jgi:hypothetical protein
MLRISVESDFMPGKGRNKLYQVRQFSERGFKRIALKYEVKML